jgi:putative ABC transport system ATP-binding protein
MSPETKVGPPLISLRDVCKGWYAGGTRIEVLHHIDLDIPPGSSTAIVGPSGSGKSTLVHILALLTPVDSGEYFFRGAPVSRDDSWWNSTIRQGIGIVFQDGKLIHNLTALKNVCVPLAHRGVWPGLQREMAEHALEQVGLSHRINSFPNQLSGGETIRCAIARAMVTNPILVLADEPTGTLDSKSGAMITDLLFGFVQEQRSLVVVSHHQPLAERADHVVRIKDGLLNAS